MTWIHLINIYIPLLLDKYVAPRSSIPNQNFIYIPLLLDKYQNCL